MRRVVTGLDSSGQAVFVEDKAMETVGADVAPPGMELVWASDEMPLLPSQGKTPPFDRHFPPPGGFRMIIATINPDADAGPLSTDELAALDAVFPGLLSDAEWDSESPGVHRTNTIDIGFVFEGAVILELDSGERRLLETGDWYVQNGTPHVWRNPSDQPCRMGILLLGAKEG